MSLLLLTSCANAQKWQRWYKLSQNLVSGFADIAKTSLDHILSVGVEVVGEDVERKRLEPWVKDVDDAVGEYSVPEQQCKQRPDCGSFTMYPCQRSNSDLLAITYHIISYRTFVVRLLQIEHRCIPIVSHVNKMQIR